MANARPARIRHASIYLKGRKIAECHSSNLDVNSGDERMFGDEGYIGHTDGASTNDASFDCVIPVAGMETDVEGALERKEYVDLASGIVNGKIRKVTGRFVKCSYKSDAKTGSLDGSFNFEGGKATRV